LKHYAQIPSVIPRSGIREIMDMACKIENVIHLEIGQPDFATPDHIIDATCSYVKKGYTKYTPNAGMDRLRLAAARYFERKTKVATGIENILVTPGAIFSIASAFLAILESGDEVLLPDPGWPNYSMMASIIHAKPIFYNLKPQNNYLPDFSELKRLVSKRTKMILICSPSNPTGQVYNSELISKFMKFAREYDLFVLSDEIYSEIIFEGEHVSALSYDTDERTLIVSGMSKSYAMTGYRVGFTRARADYIDIAAKLQEAFIACVSGFSQLAAADGLDGPQECVQKMCIAYKKCRDLALGILKKNNLYQYTPGGAFYLLIDISSTGMNSQEFAYRLLEEKKVAVAPGSTFGNISKNHIRISFASSEDNIRMGVQRIVEMIKENKQ
jgi:aspartate/methionine/tyrosine aminotransferase